MARMDKRSALMVSWSAMTKDELMALPEANALESEIRIIDGKQVRVATWRKPFVLWCPPNVPSYYECDGVRWQVGEHEGITYRSRMSSL